jgi:hypothetical protein
MKTTRRPLDSVVKQPTGCIQRTAFVCQNCTDTDPPIGKQHEADTLRILTRYVTTSYTALVVNRLEWSVLIDSNGPGSALNDNMTDRHGSNAHTPSHSYFSPLDYETVQSGSWNTYSGYTMGWIMWR